MVGLNFDSGNVETNCTALRDCVGIVVCAVRLTTFVGPLILQNLCQGGTAICIPVSQATTAATISFLSSITVIPGSSLVSTTIIRSTTAATTPTISPTTTTTTPPAIVPTITAPTVRVERSLEGRRRVVDLWSRISRGSRNSRVLRFVTGTFGAFVLHDVTDQKLA
ncbi:hypothetical protein BJ742DRAFT_576636 [Cladochytrium replicatum]|nr:hypothetical protein BJ742DRAFT_576636 [Cladochytrium replicatum]